MNARQVEEQPLGASAKYCQHVRCVTNGLMQMQRTLRFVRCMHICHLSRSCSVLLILTMLACREALLHYFRVEVVADDPLGPGSTFNAGERATAKQRLFEYAGMVEQVSWLWHAPSISLMVRYNSAITARQFSTMYGCCSPH